MQSREISKFTIINWGIAVVLVSAIYGLWFHALDIFVIALIFGSLLLLPSGIFAPGIIALILSKKFIYNKTQLLIFLCVQGLLVLNCVFILILISLVHILWDIDLTILSPIIPYIGIWGTLNYISIYWNLKYKNTTNPDLIDNLNEEL